MKKGSTGLLVLISVVVLMGAALVYFFMSRSTAGDDVSRGVSPMSATGVGEPISVTGRVVCLLPRNVNDGLMECGLGLRAADNVYYGLRDTTPDRSHTITRGAQVTVSGILRDAEPNDDFVHVGVIEIQAIEPIAENNKL